MKETKRELAKRLAEDLEILHDYRAVSMYTDKEYDETDPHEVKARVLIEEYEEFQVRNPDKCYVEELLFEALNYANP